MGPAFKVAGSDEENLVLVGWRGADRRPQFGKFGKNPRTVPEPGGKVSHEGFGRAGLIEFLKGSVSRHEVKIVGLGQFVRQVLGQSLGTGKPVGLEDDLKEMIGQLDPALAQKGANLRRVVGVVFDHAPGFGIIKNRLPALHPGKFREVHARQIDAHRFACRQSGPPVGLEVIGGVGQWIEADQTRGWIGLSPFRQRRAARNDQAVLGPRKEALKGGGERIA